MKFIATSFLATALFISQAAAHSTVFQYHAGGAALGDGQHVYIRSPPNNNPVKDLIRCVSYRRVPHGLWS